MWTGWRWTILLRVVEQELSRPERLIELLEAGWSQTAETRSSARTSELTTKQKRLQQEKERMLWLVIRRPHYCTSRRTFTAWARKVYLAWLWLGYEKGLLRPSGASQARPIILVLSLKDGHFSCRGVAQPGSAPALGMGRVRGVACARDRAGRAFQALHSNLLVMAVGYEAGSRVQGNRHPCSVPVNLNGVHCERGTGSKVPHHWPGLAPRAMASR